MKTALLRITSAHKALAHEIRCNVHWDEYGPVDMDYYKACQKVGRALEHTQLDVLKSMWNTVDPHKAFPT
jgi:hypothetical protein